VRSWIVRLRGKTRSSMKLFVFALVMIDDSCRLSRDLDLAAEVVESADQPQYGFRVISTGEVIGAEILIGDGVFKHVISGREH